MQSPEVKWWIEAAVVTTTTTTTVVAVVLLLLLLLLLPRPPAAELTKEAPTYELVSPVGLERICAVTNQPLVPNCEQR